jgi:hypothetical protein
LVLKTVDTLKANGIQEDDEEFDKDLSGVWFWISLFTLTL